jgi:hypothetical protein
MKIGLLTLPLRMNIGGALQAYALQLVIRKLGHEVLLIDRAENKSRDFINFVKELIKTILNRKSSITEIGYFVQKNIVPRTALIDADSKLEKLNRQHFDAFVVGSDQIWREKYCRSIKKNFFLDFVKDNRVKRISYAASFGVDEWEYDEKMTKELATLLQKFNAVSVREDSGVVLCRQHLNVEAVQLIDPTLLLSPEDYVPLMNSDSSAENSELLAYMLDYNESKEALCSLVGNKLSLVTSLLNPGDSQIPVSRWLQSFANARFIVTDSFHGSIFSILFKKPFLVVGNNERGMARFSSLLKMFGLENRLLLNTNELPMELLTDVIDWEKVNALLDTKREEAISFLINSLK